MQTKRKPVKNLRELRYSLCELYAAVENDEIDLKKAKTLISNASVIVGSLKVEVMNNAVSRLTNSIDFLEQEHNQKRIE